MQTIKFLGISGPGGIWTHDLEVKSLPLCHAELQAHQHVHKIYLSKNINFVEEVSAPPATMYTAGLVCE